MTRENMNRVLIGTVLAAIAGGAIYYYLNNREEVDERLGDLKDKASDALGKAKSKLSQRADDLRSQRQR